MTYDVICITQARMTSTRLPGKILKEVCDRPLLDYHVSRLLKSKRIDHLIVATTTETSDDPVEEYCQEKKVSCIRGSEEDVLSRYICAAHEYPANIIVRVTSDCPLIDPTLVDDVIAFFKENRDRYDYVALAPDQYPRGLDVEVFSREALEKANEYGKLPHEREHVTPYIYRENSAFKCGIFPSTENSGHHRWCVDEPADFDLISKILTAFEGRDDFSWTDCRELLERFPNWIDINKAVHQKTLLE